MPRRSILFIQYADPGVYPPLIHASRILAGLGWRVGLEGAVLPHMEAFPIPPHPNIQTRLFRQPPSGWPHKFHFVTFHLRAIFRAVLDRPDWIYASDTLATPSAFFLRMSGFRVVFHEHDPPDFPNTRFMDFLLMLRRMLARTANCLVLPNQRRIEALRSETGTLRPIHLVWNCPARADAQAPPHAHRPGVLRLYFHGSIVSNRVPITVLRALAICRHPVAFTLAGYDPGGGHVETLIREAGRLGIGDRIHCAGPIPQRAALLDLAARHDVGLACVPKYGSGSDPSALAGASNKVFDYMARGVVPIVTNLPEWEELVVKPGYGVSCDPRDPDSIAAVLDALAADPAARQRMADAGRARILNDWNYETTFATVRKALEAI